MSVLTDFDMMVLEFMNECGTTAQYVKTTGSYDVLTSTVTETITSIDVTAIVLDLTLQSNGYSTKYGTMVQAGDKEVFVRPPKKAGATTNPQIDPASDKIIVGGVTYKIVTFKEANPTMGSDPILYSFYVRR